MDLHPINALATDAERAAIDTVLGPPLADTTIPAAEAKARRTFLLPALLGLQTRIGHVSEGGLGYACRRLGVPPAEAFGVASFYALIALGERPAAFAHVCDDIACKAAGADQLCAELEQTQGKPAHLHHRADAPKNLKHQATWAKSPCLGLCEQAPAALVTVARASPVEQSFGHATPQRIAAALKGETVERPTLHLGSHGPRKLLARQGCLDLDAYRAAGGYQALRRALELGPEAVIREVTDARLVGRGGAAFPTGRKWEAVSKAAAHPHYMVCNADESEPGTFKDRVLLENDPFSVIEGMTVAAFATGSTKGYLYLRGEYPLAAQRLERAIGEARAKGLLGTNILSHRFDFDLELRRGGGAYICGEETSLFASIEGYRGEPRSKPPFPVQSGLFQHPTAINNVETLVAALDIVRDGAKAYGTGTKLFCVSGKVRQPGVYEVPLGITLDQLLQLAGGTEQPIKAILMGGAAGTFIGPEQTGMTLSLEGAKQAGTTLGSGVVFVIDETVELTPLLRRIAAFFRDESCGQCVPCRVGTVRQEELLHRLTRGGADRPRELALLKELGQAMRDASICGLGQTASSAIESATRFI
ncbi:MAG: NAD(P)H-dependent oxidoreductase subunit E [Archangiaceae bacterium]|nr:NAD(P)H-dependent oxidoreductase subunit E [Archangiaceae bacterium]